MGLRGPLPRQSPKPSASIATPLPPPAWLPPPAVEVWAEVEPRLRAAGRLRPEHGDTFAAWACTAAELRALSAVIARDGSTATGPHGTHPSAAHSAAARLRGTLLAIGKALGLDPASATRLDAAGGPADDGHDAIREYAAKRDRRPPADDAAPPPQAEGRPLTVLEYMRQDRGTA
jgi:P27 family predicted phage terminase small subunit